ncbi:MAG: DNA starvation/stationary phase protection protein [Actinomyces urogenitalis]|jgi:starvation-inducible DNA-binding protein|uniref:DNA starvation/stationary phase protection protein n=3 Tax=root TaxID=1 RepID=A0A2I1KSF1_9ACTO|nr:DNA starvation/stationary phase protection protein [Actinomyces urogenitalis]ETJ03598.1 MAG: DNA-binding protein Dps [Actinomyces urogenitalis DORA_12]KGF02977.1 ferritin [Actinomyces urogenitalis S6-C4]MBS5977442.1 DNA starvation/stationary phase protection protein [Actinomyces urogenitalis]MBS6071784.1 DNA starvation/stationary phase protection protein [Actinomyces urogenitalis]MCI7456192.1 DNA starvation/stationary phase protection protein [Actinomyces urogenitalis]
MSTKNVTAPAVLPTFTATPELREAFQRALTDVTALSLVGKQVHWNVVGQGFRSIHLNLDVVVDIAREASDEIAERMRALNAVPDGRPAAVADSSLPAAPAELVIVSDAVDYAVSAINATVTTLREIHKVVDETDPMSSGIIEDIALKLEQQAWFLASQNYAAE